MTNKIPGRSDGHTHADLRLWHLSVGQVLWYAKARDFDNIVSLRAGSGREIDTTTVRLSNPERKQTWRFMGSGHELTIDTGGSRSTFPVICPAVPEKYRAFSTLTEDQIYTIAQMMARPLCAQIESEGGFGPSHDGSKSCESGSLASGGDRSHCSCDSCF